MGWQIPVKTRGGAFQIRYFLFVFINIVIYPSLQDDERSYGAAGAAAEKATGGEGAMRRLTKGRKNKSKTRTEKKKSATFMSESSDEEFGSRQFVDENRRKKGKFQEKKDSLLEHIVDERDQDELSSLPSPTCQENLSQSSSPCLTSPPPCSPVLNQVNFFFLIRIQKVLCFLLMHFISRLAESAGKYLDILRHRLHLSDSTLCFQVLLFSRSL